MPDDVESSIHDDPIDFNTHVCVNYYPKKYRVSLSNAEFRELMGTICRHNPNKCLCSRPNVLTQQIRGIFILSSVKRADLLGELTRLALGTAKYLRTLLHEMEDREAWAYLESAIDVYHITCTNPDHPPHDETCRHDAAMFPTSVLLEAESRTKDTVVKLLRMRFVTPRAEDTVSPMMTEEEVLAKEARKRVKGDLRLSRRHQSYRSRNRAYRGRKLSDRMRAAMTGYEETVPVRPAVDRPPLVDIWDRKLVNLV